jgi:hypothetical protein
VQVRHLLQANGRRRRIDAQELVAEQLAPKLPGILAQHVAGEPVLLAPLRIAFDPLERIALARLGKHPSRGVVGAW